jgi:thiamine-phosphate pyrophosphorylase
MFHNLDIYYFINNLNLNEVKNLDSNINIIYRNYHDKNLDNSIFNLSKICKRYNKKLFLSNNLKLALKLNLTGLYIPSFNKNLNFKNIKKKNFKIIGSAHNISEIKIKEKQGCSEIFVSPLFFNPNYKKYLGTTRFNLLKNTTSTNLVALGGINESNYKKLKMLKITGFAGISWIKKNWPK